MSDVTSHLQTHVVDSQSGQSPGMPSEAEFNINRAFTLLTAMLILPMFLALSVVQYSLGALL